MEIWYGIIGIAIGLLAGIMVGIIIRKNVSEKTIGSAEQHAKNIVLDAEHQAETIKKEKKLEAQEEALKMKNEIEKEIKQRRNEISKSENRLIQKEETIAKIDSDLKDAEALHIRTEWMQAGPLQIALILLKAPIALVVFCTTFILKFLTVVFPLGTSQVKKYLPSKSVSVLISHCPA